MIETIEANKVTKDLAICQHGNKVRAGPWRVEAARSQRSHVRCCSARPGACPARLAAQPAGRAPGWSTSSRSPRRATIQVTPDMYLNTTEFMDAIAATFQAKRAQVAA